jgi:hypothetical protein
MSTLNIANEPHLFLMSSHQSHITNKLIPKIIRKNNLQIINWELGSYMYGQARLFKSSCLDSDNINLSQEFATTLEIVSGSIVIATYNNESYRSRNLINQSIFCLNFLGYDWLFSHIGKNSSNVRLIPDDQKLLEVYNQSTEIFEFVRKHIINYYLSSPKKSLIEACRYAFSQLLDFCPNTELNFILSNGFLTFIFINSKNFYLVNLEEDNQDVSIVSSLNLENEDNVELKVLANKQAKMIVFNGHTLIFNGDLTK